MLEYASFKVFDISPDGTFPEPSEAEPDSTVHEKDKI
jgi:hypothetical protein